MPLVAGVDSSTQSCKVVVRDAESGALVRSGSAPHPDGTEVDPAAWWTALRAAVQDPAAGGRVLEALVGVTLAPDTDSDGFAAACSRLEPVAEVLHMAGVPDYQVRVACRDTGELDRLLRGMRRDLGAERTETRVILRTGAPVPSD